jgi:4-hydroxy-4-methyl-2-oxoglutarate aldolase
MKSLIVTKVSRPDPEVVRTLGDLGSATVHEAMGKDGSGKAALMKPHIRPIDPSARVSGTAITVTCAPGDNLMIHAALEVCRQGDVLVVAIEPPSQEAYGMFGDLLAVSAKAQGVVGLVIESGVRDTAELIAIDFPTWSQVISAQGTTKEKAGSVNLPIVCGGVTVNAGDVVVADNDGVVIVPRARAAEIAEKAQERAAKEERTREQLRDGQLTMDLWGFRPRMKELGVEYVEKAPEE